jgi:hypothetical protein
MRGGRIFIIARLLGAALLLLSTGCVKAEVLRHQAEDASPPVANRMDCNKVYGTAYHSPEERQWFEGNCMSWPAFRAADPAPAAAPSSPDAACQSVAGRPYASDQERLWFLTNCVGRASTTAQGSSVPTAAGPDRTSCDEVRGTPYRSDAERAWYIRTCPPPPPQTQPVASNPPPPFGIVPQQPFPFGR